MFPGKVTVNIDISKKRGNLFGRCPNILDRKGKSKRGAFDGQLLSRNGDH